MKAWQWLLACAACGGAGIFLGANYAPQRYRFERGPGAQIFMYDTVRGDVWIYSAQGAGWVRTPHTP